ncbi:MAG: cytochrome c-type biogenesis protein [Thermodesulfobacteriota bacterium]|nr:cytochrome c-type biogenesis protein [Thermodesulfobacteriota bacterium]
MSNFIWIFIVVFSLTGFNLLANDQVYQVSNELMCPVCQGQTVAESNSELAISMRKVIENKVNQGESKEKILEYFVNQYGDNILAKPPLKGFNLFLWIIPPFILLLSILLWILRVRASRSSKKQT